MRPLDKGGPPQNAEGQVIEPRRYHGWRRELLRRIGYYCAYCNQPLSHELQVEHVQPKNPPQGYAPGDSIAWDNMLLACGPCNNAKSNSPVDAATYYLPEEHNTHIPFTSELVKRRGLFHMIVRPRPGLNPLQQRKAAATIALLKLDQIDTRAAVVDIRSQRRFSASQTVTATRIVYDMAKGSETFDQAVAARNVAKVACSVGFFSLWYEAFADDPYVLGELINNDSLTSVISGTAQDCFDLTAGFAPIPRNPGNLTDPL